MRKKRLGIYACLLGAAALFLIGAQLRICTFKNQGYSKSAASQRSESILVKKYRGLFYDRNMIPLVDSTSEYVTIDSGGNIKKGKGDFTINPTVRYGKGSLASHLIGYVDSDGTGVSGLEKCFNSTLLTDNTFTVNVITDASGRVVRGKGVGLSDDKSGSVSSVKLTLDYHIQKIAESCMDKYGEDGAVVVMDVNTSDVLAMASRPQFDRNNVKKYLNSNGSELVNRCISSYNAGSIFKIITSAAAIEANTAQSDYSCSGVFSVDGKDFACHNSAGHGNINFENAFSKSCNCAFYEIGIKTGADKILSTARSFGLGEKILCYDNLPEMPGNLPIKPSYGVYEAVNYSIGQGEILITPVQAANMVCIIANNGIANCVNIADSITDESGAVKRSLRETMERRVISRSTALEIQNCMRLAVTDGTASGADSEVVQIAGKTGTAQTGWYKEGENLVHGWFCGYFPYDNPKYAMAVLIENGKSGSASAVPLFRSIAEEIIKIYPAG